jgi:hypothetical protein
MKDGRTHLAHKAEHAVDLETGAIVAVTLQGADQGDTSTIVETATAAAEQIEAAQVDVKAPQPLEEIIADKGYHSNETMVDLDAVGIRSYVAEPDRGRRDWSKEPEAQAPVYENRRRIRGKRGRRLMRRRGERIGWSSCVVPSVGTCNSPGGLRVASLQPRRARGQDGPENTWHEDHPEQSDAVARGLCRSDHRQADARSHRLFVESQVMKRLVPIISILALTVGLAARQAPKINVTNAMILNPTPDSWPTYFGDYSGKRYSSLTKINDKTVKNLSLAWMADTTGGGIKATPLLVNSVLFFATPDHAWAMDARTGRELWHYTWTHNRGGIHIGNRGVALYGNTVYFETPDCNLVALEADTGKLKWFKEICSLEMVYYASVAPLIVKDKIITGVSGDDLDMPGYVDARSLETGDLIWRWYVTPQKKDDPGIETWPNLEAAQHGGGMTWQPFTYDPEANLILHTPHLLYTSARNCISTRVCPSPWHAVQRPPSTLKLKWPAV